MKQTIGRRDTEARNISTKSKCPFCPVNHLITHLWRPRHRIGALWQDTRHAHGGLPGNPAFGRNGPESLRKFLQFFGFSHIFLLLLDGTNHWISVAPPLADPRAVQRRRNIPSRCQALRRASRRPASPKPGAIFIANQSGVCITVKRESLDSMDVNLTPITGASGFHFEG